MKRRTFIKTSIAAAAASTVFKPFQLRAQGKKYVFGFSQATIVEPWRVQFNKDMQKEADKNPEIQLIITDGQDKTEKQVADVESLIQQGVDVLLVSPKESAGLTGVIIKAIDAKIPVIVLDRNVNTDKYTQFIGGDNVVIGKAAGEYAVKLLGGPGAAKGSSADRERQKETLSSYGEEWERNRRMIGTMGSTSSLVKNRALSRYFNPSTAIGSRRRATTR